MLTVSHLRGQRSPKQPCAASPYVSGLVVSLPPQRRLIAPFGGIFSAGAALVAVALCMVFTSVRPAWAGHYGDPVYTYSGSTVVTYPANPSFSATHTWVDGIWQDYPTAYANDNGPASCVLDGTVTAKFTWVKDDSTDTAPPKVWINESAQAGWSVEGGYTNGVTGSRSVSIGGETTDYDYGEGDFSNKYHSRLKSHLHERDGGDEITLTCTIHAECSSPGTPYPDDDPNDTDVPPPYEQFLTIGGGYTVGIIPTPYDFKWVRIATPAYEHTLAFDYTWKSTSGSLNQLADVLVYEHVEYPGGNATTSWAAPSPFTKLVIPHNPIDIHLFPQDTLSFWAWGSDGEHPDGHVDCIGQKSFNAFDYTGTFTANQEYRWYLPLIHDVPTANGVDKTGFSVMDGDGPMHPIVRTVVKEPAGNYYRYTVTKHGETLTWYFDPDTDL